MVCHFCRKEGKIFRTLPVDEQGHVREWCGKCAEGLKHKLDWAKRPKVKQ